MFRYRNEAAFSKAFCKLLKDHGWFVQRIETGTTGKGVPDIYAVAPTGIACWFELKRIHQRASRQPKLPIPWRPGQQAWLSTVTKYGQFAYTVACFDDCIMQIPHNRLWPMNCIYPHDSIKQYYRLVDLIK